MNEFKRVKVPKNDVRAIDLPTNHILVIDCSGSMSYDLPKIRQQLKNKLPSTVKENDTVSLVWFSGRGEFGCLVDRVKVNDLNDLNRLNTSIDRWLKPIGCTGFVEPLHTVEDLMKELQGVYSMMFLTDGCDNEWSRSEILEATRSLGSCLAGAVFVEYGWYCNHQLLEDMASEIGGSVVFAEDFDRYEPIFDGVIRKGYKSAKRVPIEVGNPLFDLVWAVGENGPKTFKVKNGKVSIPEYIDEIFFFTDKEEKRAISNSETKAILQGLSVLALRRKGQFVKQTLKDLQEGYLYNHFLNCFGKQNLYDFQHLLIDWSNDEIKVGSSEKDFIENKTAFTVLDLLNLLRKSDCKIDLEKMKYNRIGRMTEPDKRLTEDEKKELIKAIENAQAESEVKAAVDKIASVKKDIKFRWNNKQHCISSITWNETRPNVSMLFHIDGIAEIGENNFGLDQEFPTSIWRNYAIIRDGLLNIEVLPVILDFKTYNVLYDNGVIFAPFVKNNVYEIDLRRMPLLCESLVEEVRAENYFHKLYNFLSLKAAKKVYTAFQNEINPPDRVATLAEKYGEDAAQWLQSIGITDQGFSPKVTLTPGKDHYTATELVTKMKGLSSVPSFNAFKKKLDENKKLNAADQLLEKHYNIALSIKEAYTVDGKLDAKTFERWLLKELLDIDEDLKRLTVELAKIRFSIIVGQTWFKEFETIENCKLSMEFIEGQPIECSVELKDTEVTI